MALLVTGCTGKPEQKERPGSAAGVSAAASKPSSTLETDVEWARSMKAAPNSAVVSPKRAAFTPAPTPTPDLNRIRNQVPVESVRSLVSSITIRDGDVPPEIRETLQLSLRRMTSELESASSVSQVRKDRAIGAIRNLSGLIDEATQTTISFERKNEIRRDLETALRTVDEYLPR